MSHLGKRKIIFKMPLKGNMLNRSQEAIVSLNLTCAKEALSKNICLDLFVGNMRKIFLFPGHTTGSKCRDTTTYSQVKLVNNLAIDFLST